MVEERIVELQRMGLETKMKAEKSLQFEVLVLELVMEEEVEELIM